MCDAHEQFAALSKDDQRLLDALVASGFDLRAIEPLTEDERRRVRAIMQVFSGFEQYEPADGTDEAPPQHADDRALIDATMARINRYEQYRRGPAEAVLHYSRSRLSSADQRVLDALVEARFDLTRLEAHLGPIDDVTRQRAEMLVSLFELLNDYPVEDGGAHLIDLVMHQLDQIETAAAAPTSQSAHGDHLIAARSVLREDDARLLDLLVEHNFDRLAIERLTEIERRRVDRLSAVFSLLESYPVQSGDRALIDAAMARVQQHDFKRARLEAAMQSEAKTDGRRRRRMPDFISAAAIILLCASVLWPMWNHVHDGSAPSHRVEMAGEPVSSPFDGRYDANATAGVSVVNSPVNRREVSTVLRASGESDVYLFVVRMPDGRFKVYRIHMPLNRKLFQDIAD